MAFDDIFECIGEFGTYQICLFLLLGLPCMYSGFQSMAMIFLGPYHDHWCKIEELLKLPYAQQKLVGIPFDAETESYKNCEYYNIPYENYTKEELCAWDRTYYNNTPEEVTCTKWTYDLTQYSKTAVSEFDLVCDQSFLVGIVYSSYILALLIAAFITGVISDYLGRRPVLLVASIFSVIFTILAALSPNYWLFLTFRFFLAYCASSVTTCCFVMLAEYVGPKYREVVGALFWCYFAVGFMLLPIMAYFVTDFRKLQLVFAAIMIPPTFYTFIISESPRWLIANGKFQEAIVVLQYMAKVNRKSLPTEAQVLIISDSKEDTKETKGQIGDEGYKWSILFTNPTMRKAIAINIPAWVASGLVYNGLSFNIGQLAGSIYLNTFLFGLLEIPANIFALISMHYIGRRKTQIISLIVAGGFCLLCVPFTTDDGSILVTALAMIGKTFITISYTTIYLFTAEQFPTNIRHIAHGVCNMLGNIASMLAPFMGAPLTQIWLPLPLLIFGSAGIITGPLLLLLPETKGKDLPDTLKDAEDLWKQRKKIAPVNYKNEQENTSL